MANSNQDSNINLNAEIQYYIQLFLSRWKFIIFGVAEVVIVALIISQLATPMYQSTTTLYVGAAGDRPDELNSVRVGLVLAETYSELVTSRDVLQQTILQLGLTISADTLRSQISTRPVENTQLFRIIVQNDDPVVAANIANTLANVLIEKNTALQNSGFDQIESNLAVQIDHLESQIAQTEAVLEQVRFSDADELARLTELLAQYNLDYNALLRSYEEVRLESLKSSPNVSSIETAVPAQSPISPNPIRNTILAAVAGIIFTMGIILAQDYLDDRINNPEALSRQVSLPILGQILHFDAQSERLITMAQPRSPVSEAFRSMRLNLKYVSIDQPLKTLLVTSPSPEEGKSTLASNLSVTLAQGGQKVLLVDADLRRPTIHSIFKLSNRLGLSDLFILPFDIFDEIVRHTNVPNLDVLASGPLPPNPSELFDTEKAGEIFAKFAERYDMVIVDAPPTMALTDSIALSQHVDGITLLARMGKTTNNIIEQVLYKFGRVNANIVGLTFIGIDKALNRGGYYYSSYYETVDSYYHNHNHINEGEESQQEAPADSKSILGRLTAAIRN